MSAIDTMASSIATSTCWPSPVRSRCRSAASTPIVANNPLAVSPRAPIGDGTGGWVSANVKSYWPDMASTPEAGEQLGGERKCLHLLEGEHAHPVERLAVRRRAGVGDVPEPHGPTLRANVTVRQKRPYAEPVTTRGIVSYGAYLPHRRLDRAEIAPVAGTGGGKGTRTVASFDE